MAKFLMYEYNHVTQRRFYFISRRRLILFELYFFLRIHIYFYGTVYGSVCETWLISLRSSKSNSTCDFITNIPLWPDVVVHI